MGSFADKQKWLEVDVNGILSPLLFSIIYTLGDSLNYAWKLLNHISEGALESTIFLDHLGWDTLLAGEVNFIIFIS